MELKKGFIFTIDALLGIAIVLTLLSTAALITISDPNTPNQQSKLMLQADEDALISFYTGSTIKDVPSPTAISVNCQEILEYKGSVQTRVKKCKELTR